MASDDSLSHLVYTSLATNSMKREDLFKILEHCRVKNGERNVTGMLLYMGGSFFQVLEGPADLIEKLFNKISEDERHHKVMKLIFEPIAERSFSKWTMGYQNVTPSELVSIAGLTNFLDQDESSFETVEVGRARKLMEAFRDGRWQVAGY